MIFLESVERPALFLCGFVERWEEFLNKMKWSKFLSSWECGYGLEGIYNLFNNSGRTCGIIEMWETGRWEDEVGDSFVRTETVLTLR